MTTAAPTDLTPPRPIVELIPVSMIDPSPTNPRKTFVQAELDELAESLKAVGQLENILVRPSPSKPKRFELVFGERRWRAAKIAKLPELLSAIKELTDVQTLEVQLIENAKRKDLHPIEEAETYEALHKKHGYSVDDIAAKVGTSKAAVYARLKLCALGPEARKLFLEGKLTPSTALYVARIPVPALQKQAATEIATRDGGEPLSARDAAEHVRSKYMLRLAEAPFDKADAELVAGAGPCTTCPKRTGNQKELFDDVKSGDVCTDPVCFGKKRDAVWEKKTAAAKAEGTKVLSETESKKLFPYGAHHIAGDYVDVKDTCNKDPKGRQWKSVMGKHAPDVVIARDPDGNVRELVPAGAATAALKKAGHTWAKPEPRQLSPKKKTEKGLDELVEQLGRDRLFEAAGKKTVADAELLRLVVRYVLATGQAIDEVAQRRGLVSKTKSGRTPPMATDRALLSAAKKAKAPELRKLVVELLVAEMLDPYAYKADEMREAAFSALGVDQKAIAAEAKKKLEASKKPEPAKGSKVLKVTKRPTKAKSKPKKPAKKKGGAK